MKQGLKKIFVITRILEATEIYALIVIAVLSLFK